MADQLGEKAHVRTCSQALGSAIFTDLLRSEGVSEGGPAVRMLGPQVVTSDLSRAVCLATK